MKFGVRECANIVFRAKQETKIGTNTFHVGQPVLYIDTATTTSMEQASSTVYAQGGRGNARLIAWEGDKTLTFTVTDALISPVSLSMLSGAGLIKESGKMVHVHATTAATLVKPASGTTWTIDMTEALKTFGTPGALPDFTGAQGTNPHPATASIDAGADAPIFLIKTEDDGSITGDIVTSSAITYVFEAATSSTPAKAFLEVTSPQWNGTTDLTASTNVLVDYYVMKQAETVSEIQLTAADFAGYYYVEADTLFRSQATGIDMPANLTFPNVKVQSGFTIAMSGTGDPSTFDFTMDAFPGYTYFDKSRQVLCVIQVVEDSLAAAADIHSVMLANNSLEHRDVVLQDSDTTEPTSA